jgi:hypothetical protein
MLQVIVVTSASLALAACTKTADSTSASRTPAPAHIEGDVYVVMKSGDVKRIAGNRVYLLKADTAKLAPACKAVRIAAISYGTDTTVVATKRSLYEIFGGRTRRAEIDAAVRARDSTDRAANEHALALARSVDSAVVASAPTGVGGRFRFDSVSPGSYVLHARTSLYGTTHAWFVPITLGGGASVTRDLDNDALTTRSVCTLDEGAAERVFPPG